MGMEWGKRYSRNILGWCRLARAGFLHDRGESVCHHTICIQRFYMPFTWLMRKDSALSDGNVRKLIEDASFPNQWPTKETHIQHKVLYKNGVSKEYGVHGSNVGVDFDICIADRSEEHTSELQSPMYLVCR